MAYPTRQLGANGPQVTAIGFGMMGLSAYYGKAATDEERFKFLDYIYERGERFWDSADIYGDSEELIGKWFDRNPGKRQNIVLATKFGIISGTEANSSPEYARERCERSLKRLRTDYIDLYYVHRVDPNTPIELTVRAMAELKKEGKIKYLGLSEVSTATLRRAQAVHPIAAVQMEYSPWALEVETTGMLDACKELGVAVVAYSPLGRGMLTGQFKSPADFEADDFRATLPRFSAENFPKSLELVSELQSVAAAKGCTPGQLALAWLLRQWDMVIPIPGTRRVNFFEENMAALQVTLTDEEDAAIRAAVDRADLKGTRYAHDWVPLLLGDTVPLKE